MATLRKMLNRACLRAGNKLQSTIDRNAAKLVKALVPMVKRKRLAKQQAELLPQDDEAWLASELTGLAGRADELFKHANVEVRYKGVTYQTLKRLSLRRSGGSCPT